VSESPLSLPFEEIDVASAAQSISNAPSPLAWFWQFFKEELAPYPGRAELVARIVIAATLVMILTMTFRIPFGAYAAIYTFLISRESPRQTVTSAMTEVVVFVCAALYILVGAMLFVNHPMFRLLWIIATLFIMFYALNTMTSYIAAVRFGWLIVITIPLWDLRIPAEAKLEGLLWAVGAITLASLVAVVVELVFAGLRTGDELVSPLAERLAAVEELLQYYAKGEAASQETEKRITRLAMLGTSNLRRVLRRSGCAPHYAEQMGAAVVLVGRLVDVAANLRFLAIWDSDEDRRRARDLARSICGIRADLLKGRTPNLIPCAESVLPGAPLLREMERTVCLIPEVFASAQPLSRYASTHYASGDPPPTLFVRDTWSNPEHIQFALKGCLAAGLCYIIYNAVSWPGISTAVTTCFLTALSTVGSSHQKQFMRIAGAVAGGVLGIAIQVLILPELDSIGGFTVLFVAIMACAAWVATAGPRLSYVGLQVALVFCIINLQEFRIQTALAPARDRAVGVLLGLSVMWLVFDQLWSAPAVGQMKMAFAATLRLLADLSQEPRSRDLRVASDRSYFIRETINKNFEQTRALADGVLFEFGPSRKQDLLWRDRIVRWQPQVRILFLTRIALWKYRAQLPGFELPEAIQAAQQEFDYELAGKLDEIANRMDSKAKSEEEITHNLLEAVERTIQTHSSEETGTSLAPRCQALLRLCRTAESLTISLDKELRVSQAPVAGS
jgi:multidrug resistance protein MdtO